MRTGGKRDATKNSSEIQSEEQLLDPHQDSQSLRERVQELEEENPTLKLKLAAMHVMKVMALWQVYIRKTLQKKQYEGTC